jgi:hypothetical protein
VIRIYGEAGVKIIKLIEVSMGLTGSTKRTKNAFRILIGNILENGDFKDTEGDRRIILRFILGRLVS